MLGIVKSKGPYFLFLPLGIFALFCSGLSYYSYGSSSYQFRNFSGRLDQVIGLKDPNNFRIALIGDCRDNMEALERIIQDARGKSDFAFILGDLVNRGTESQFNFFIHELDELEREFGQRYPIYTLIGNHDLDEKKSSELYQRYFGPDHFWLFAGKTLFIGINNVEKEIYEQELIWLDQVLKEKSGEADQIFVLMHKPPFVVHHKGHHPPLSKDQTRELMKVLRKYPIQAIFASHIHDHLEYKSKGIKVYVTGEGGAPQTHKKNPQYGYLVLTISGREYQVERISLGDIFNHDWMEQLIMAQYRPIWPWLFGVCLTAVFLTGIFQWKKFKTRQV